MHDVVAGYAILGELGRGGMGVVYRGWQVSLKRHVALKMILAGNHAGSEGLRRFKAEAEAVAQLQHANIVQVYEVGEHDGRPFFAMEYVGGASLAGALARRPLATVEAARLTETLARAVQHAHQRGIVHRDLKPANILLTEDGTPKIADFGLAKRLEDDDAAQTRSGAVLGTPSYMSPEQAQGKTNAVGPLVDVYALGAILYELLTGRPPFRGPSVMQTMQQVIHDEPIPPSRERTGIGCDLETICLKALAKDPAQRYGSALALAQDLERYLAGEPILARRAGVVRRLWHRARRNPVKALAIPVLLLALGAAAIGYQVVGTIRRAADVSRAIEDGLRAKEWRRADGDEIERLIAELDMLDSAQAVSARRLLHEHFADCFREGLHRPRLESGDIEALKTDLAWLATRDAGLAKVLGDELQQRERSWQPRLELAAPWKGLADVMDPAQVQAGTAALTVKRAAAVADKPVLTRMAAPGPLEVEATFDESWQDSARIGVLLNTAGGRRGYAFRVASAADEAAASEAAAPAKSSLSFRQAGGAVMEIVRNGVVLRRRPIALGAGRLTLAVRRERDRLHLQVNSGEPLVFFDVVPLQTMKQDVIGLDWPGGVGLARLRASEQSLPGAASSLERGDQLFDERRYAEALALYQEQVLTATSAEANGEARCKAGLCLVALNRLDEAAGLFEPLAVQTEGHWGVRAACRLWLIRLEQQRHEEAGAVFASLRVRVRPGELAAYVPEEVRRQLLRTVYLPKSDAVLPTEKTLRRLEELVPLADLLDDPWRRAHARYDLLRAYALMGEEQKALAVSTEALVLALEIVPTHPDFPVWVAHWDTWLRLQRGETAPALTALRDYSDRYELALGRVFADARSMRFYFTSLYLDQARLLVALGAWAEAEKRVDDFLRHTPDPVANYGLYAAGWLLKGLLCERRGAADQAQRAWKQGLYPTYLQKLAAALPAPGAAPARTSDGKAMALYSILASLTDELSDADAEVIWNGLVLVFAGESLVSQVGSILRPSPAVLRGMWRTPNGRECARRMAFLDVPPAEYARLSLLAGIAEKVRQDALGARTTPEQDEIVWASVRAVLDAVFQRRITQAQAVQIGLTWKGTTNLFGWGGVAPSLDPALRGGLAYIFGHRYLRLNRPDDARAFFRTALADAPPGTVLRRRASEEAASANVK